MIDVQPEIITQRSRIDGQWVDLSATDAHLADPNTGELRQPKCTTSLEDVERALQAARDLHDGGQLEDTALEDRVELLLAVADRVEAIAERIAFQDSINTGTPINTTRLIADSFGDRIRGAARDAAELGPSITLGDVDRPVYLLRKPLGPALIVGPWNAPTFTVIGKVAAAMAAGCPVLLKPSENAPGGCQLFSEILVDEMRRRDYPEAAFQLIHGSSSIGAVLTGDPRIEVLSFTGGGSAGRTVAAAAASNLNAMQLELGSNNPAIVLDDADLEAAAASIVDGMTRLNGQWCEAPGKILVMESVHDDFVEAMRTRIDSLRIGHCLEPETQVGPLAFERHFTQLGASLDRLVSLGGEKITATDMPALNGWFMAPGMVIGCRAEDATEELFGPVVTVHAVASEAEALAHANAAGGALDAFVFSADHDRALRIAGRIRAGEVRINGTFMSDLAEGSQQTFWGTSGIGGHGPQNGVRLYLGDRVVGVDRTDLPL